MAKPPPINDRPAAFPRINTSRPARFVRVVGRRRSPRDAYHWLLEAPWLLFAVVVAAAYLSLNVLFAWLYMVDPAGLGSGAAAHFLSAFFFSVETLGAIGYGVIAPQSTYAHTIVTLESAVGLTFIAVNTGLIFARVSRPTARITFSRNAVVAPYDGVPTLMFRCANDRVNQILEAEVQISVARQQPTAEGRVMRRLEEVRPVRSRSPLFALTWTILIPLDETSPLHGASAESLASDQAELIIVLSGVDEGFAARIHARHSYMPHEIVWGRQFADILSVDPDGRRVIDYGRFHELEPLDG